VTVDALPSAGFRDSPTTLLARAHERRAAIRALAALSNDAADCALLLDALDLDAADGLVDLPPLERLPALPPPPPEPEHVDLRPVGLRVLADVPGPISPPQQRAPKVTPARHERAQRPGPARGAGRTPKPDAQAPADGLCPSCPLPWRHRGRHATTLDAAEAARRYLAGEGLFSLAAALHVGSNTLRKALRDQGVQLRGRGDVIGTRGRPATPLDEDEVRRLYAAGHTTVEIGRALGARGTRVADILRAHGELRAAGHRGPVRPDNAPPQAPRPARTPRPVKTGICAEALCGKPNGHSGAHFTGCTEQVVTKVTPEVDRALRAWAAELGQSVSEYLRSLIHADLTAQGRIEEQS
jgi:hypothetical protein